MKRVGVLATTVLATLSLAAPSLGQTNRRHHIAASRSSVQPDQVIQWNQEMLQLLQIPGAQPATIHPTRTMEITEISVFDAVNAIRGVRASHQPGGRRARRASLDAAAASAARTALLGLLPSQQQVINAKFQDSLSQIGSGPRVEQGIRVGERVAQAILASRANDGAGVTPPPFTPASQPGEYQLTPPSFQQPVFTQWSAVKPFVLRSGAQFRPPPPPTVSSSRYADDFNEVKALGRQNSTIRSADQTAIGEFWGAAPVQNVWNQIAELAGAAFHNSLTENARMFALVDTSLADGVVALYDAKYAYHRWRPVTAIQAADTGNPNAVGDPAWTPLATTAPDPSYPGAHAEISESAATALRDFFGTDRFDFSLSNASVPGVVRNFASFSQAADEASASRIFAGQHFRYDEDAGQAMGGQVGNFVFNNALRARS